MSEPLLPRGPVGGSDTAWAARVRGFLGLPGVVRVPLSHGGEANNPTLTVNALLAAVNQQAVNGVLYNGDTTLRQQAADLFDALNNAGSI